MNYTGHIDIYQQSHIQGWCAAGSDPTSPKVLVSGKEVGRIEPGLRRPDLVAYGISERSGFNFNFPDPLTETDEISVVFDDGSLLGGEPFTKHQVRLRNLFTGIDVANMEGLELGPLDRPLLSKKRSKVYYVDNASTEDLIAKTRDDDKARCDWRLIVPTDIVWNKPLDQCVPKGRKFDYCISSHVIEHIPDMIGWIQQIGSVLREGAVANFAMPHRNFTFDYRRRTTSPSQFIGWHMRKLMRPAPEQVFDHVAYASFDVGSERPLQIDAALDAARRSVDTDEYLEVHCNVFTEKSFLQAFSVITRAGLLKFRLGKMFPNIPGTNELVVSLVKDSKSDPSALSASFTEGLRLL